MFVKRFEELFHSIHFQRIDPTCRTKLKNTIWQVIEYSTEYDPTEYYRPK